MNTQLISELKKQREKLDGLIGRLKDKDRLEKTDLGFYDETTREIEKRLRTLRSFIARDLKDFKTENNQART